MSWKKLLVAYPKAKDKPGHAILGMIMVFGAFISMLIIDWKMTIALFFFLWGANISDDITGIRHTHQTPVPFEEREEE